MRDTFFVVVRTPDKRADEPGDPVITVSHPLWGTTTNTYAGHAPDSVDWPLGYARDQIEDRLGEVNAGNGAHYTITGVQGDKLVADSGVIKAYEVDIEVHRSDS